MPSRSSRRRYREYKADLARRRKEGVQVDWRGRERDRRSRNHTFVELFKAFWGLAAAQRKWIFGSLALLTVSTLVGLAPLYVPKLVIDHVLGDEPMPGWLTSAVGEPSIRLLLTVLVLVAIGLTLIAQGVGLAGRWQATRLSKRLQVDVRRESFEHASRLPLWRVYELKSGGVSSILRDDAGAVGGLVFSMLYNPWQAVIQLLGSLAVLIFVDWRLLLGAMVVLPVVWVTHRTWISRIRPLFRDIRSTRRGIDARATEAFGGMRVVRAFGRRRSESGRFVGASDLMVRQELHSWWWMRGVDLAWAILIPLASAALLYFGALQILSDRQAVADGMMDAGDALTIGGLVAFLTYLGALLRPIATLAATATGLQDALAGLDRVMDLLEEPIEMPSPPEAVTVRPEQVAGRVELRDVGFRYSETAEWALRDVSLTAKPGQTIALVGASGAGKTTMCNLVARFYDPTEGRILLDGTDLRDIDVDSFRQLLGVVEQDIFLFDGSVRDNIGYGRRGSSDADVQKAARLAAADEFIRELPEGYDTLIGERGVKLSGGQRQRLAIARAVLADPRILILDEATSNLDTHSERLIQSSLLRLMTGRTSFVIAHRLSTILHADQILVLDHGRVVERGTHDELMHKEGVYENMIQMQLAPVQADGEPVEV